MVGSSIEKPQAQQRLELANRVALCWPDNQELVTRALDLQLVGSSLAATRIKGSKQEPVMLSAEEPIDFSDIFIHQEQLELIRFCLENDFVLVTNKLASTIQQYYQAQVVSALPIFERESSENARCRELHLKFDYDARCFYLYDFQKPLEKRYLRTEGQNKYHQQSNNPAEWNALYFSRSDLSKLTTFDDTVDQRLAPLPIEVPKPPGMYVPYDVLKLLNASYPSMTLAQQELFNKVGFTQGGVAIQIIYNQESGTLTAQSYKSQQQLIVDDTETSPGAIHAYDIGLSVESYEALRALYFQVISPHQVGQVNLDLPAPCSRQDLAPAKKDVEPSPTEAILHNLTLLLDHLAYHSRVHKPRTYIHSIDSSSPGSDIIWFTHHGLPGKQLPLDQHYPARLAWDDLLILPSNTQTASGHQKSVSIYNILPLHVIELPGHQASTTPQGIKMRSEWKNFLLKLQSLITTFRRNSRSQALTTALGSQEVKLTIHMPFTTAFYPVGTSGPWKNGSITQYALGIEIEPVV